MTNIDHAAKIIDAWTQDGHELNSHVGNPRDLARTLSDAGLLAPDLPGPTHRAGMGAAGTDYPMTGGRFARVHLHESDEYLWAMFNPGQVTLIHNQGKRADTKGRTWPDTRDMRLTPDAAREIAYTLLAAANHAERHHHE